ncbi:hypothetical protein FRB90_003106 [Tulasnella sp. 427]|nr:hypothetical protein FRB90_003106 [Tulasnella sp. 427]
MASRFANPTFLWRTGALLVASGIVTGAFGAHAIRKRVAPEKLVAWNSASHYAFLNGLGLLAISLHPRFSVHKFAGPAIALGCVFFSGSIPFLVLNPERFKFLGPVTPIGGSLMIAGYVALAL